MSKIPESYLPPKELWPSRVYELPEHKNIPQSFNSTEVLIDDTVAAGKGDNVAILFEDQKITYAQLQKMVNSFGNKLKELGVEEGDRVMLRLPNIPPALVANFATIKIGAVILPTSPLFARTEIAHVANLSEAKVLVVASTLMDEVSKAMDNLKTVKKIIVIGGEPEGLRQQGFIPYPDMMKGSPELAAVKRDRMDVSVLLFTSGTTGLPKGTAHFMEESLIVADGFGKYCWNVTEKDVIGGPAPLAMAAGYSMVGVIPFRHGASVSLIPRFTPEAGFETIQKHKITVFSALPTAYRKMMQIPDATKYDLSSIRVCTGGGESLTAHTYNEWKKMFGLEIFEGLGSTEMMYVFISSAATKNVKPGSIGPAIPGYKLKVIHSDSKECDKGMVGQLIAQGPTGTIYWRDPEKQRAAVTDGWCKVGDMVTMDEDGYIWFLSREDDLIKSSGYRIGPEEIEEALVSHPNVLDAGVIGVPDPVIGQKTKAFVLLQPEIEPNEELKKELVEFCRDKIAIYKLPREVEFVKELPRTQAGKLLRRVLRAQETEKRKAMGLE